MLKPKPPTKREQEAFASALRKFQKTQEKVEETKSAPLKATDTEKLNCIILDVDGTLCFRTNRGIFDFPKSIDDLPALATIAIANSALAETIVVIVTGREEQYRSVTEEWLGKNKVNYHELYMRRTGDRRPSNIVKEDIYIQHIRDRFNVIFCIDDRQQDLDMYRKNGLYCFFADNSREYSGII